MSNKINRLAAYGLLALAAAALLYGLGRWDARAGARDAALDAQFGAAIRAAAAANRGRVAALTRSDSLGALARQLDAAGARARRRADSLQAVTVAGHAALTAAASPRDSLTAALGLVGTLAGEVAALRLAAGADSAARTVLLADVAQLRAALERQGAATDSVAAALEAVRRATGCRLGVGPVSVGCPSRRTVAVLGVLLGAGLVAAVQ